jgi:hypothetical protein
VILIWCNRSSWLLHNQHFQYSPFGWHGSTATNKNDFTFCSNFEFNKYAPLFGVIPSVFDWSWLFSMFRGSDHGCDHCVISFHSFSVVFVPLATSVSSCLTSCRVQIGESLLVLLGCSYVFWSGLESNIFHFSFQRCTRSTHVHSIMVPFDDLLFSLSRKSYPFNGVAFVSVAVGSAISVFNNSPWRGIRSSW